MTCPGDLALARSLSVGAGPELAAHLEACAACRAAWDGAQAAIDLARALPAALPPPARREEIRTAVLAAATVRTERPARRWWLAPAIAGAAAAGIAGYLALRPAPPPPPGPPHHAHGTVRPHAGARYAVRSAGPDEVVDLGDGVIDVEVEPLPPGERFRVIVGGDELEVRGTAFTAAARGGHLTDVAVAHGRVDLTSDRGARATLTSGQAWHTAVAAATADPPPSIAPSPPPRPAPVVPSSAARGMAAPHRDDPAPSSGTRVMTAPHRDDPAPSSAARGVIAPRRDSPVPSAARVAAAPHRDDLAAAPPPASRVAVPPHRDALAPMPPPSGRSPAELSYDDAWAALRTGDFARAATGFARVLLLTPDGPLAEDAGFWRAVALARGQRGPEAVAAFRDFLDVHPRSPRAGEASAMLGWLLIDARAYDEAARRFDAAIGDASPAVRQSAKAGLDALAARKR